MTITPPGFRDRTVAVMGLARSGIASVRALIRGGARVKAWDDAPDRRAQADALGAVLVDLAAPGALADAAALVLSPGIPHTHPAPHPAAAAAVAAGVPILGDLELLLRACPKARTVAITGTNGKSTTTALVGHILRQAGRTVAVGGNIGAPALDLPALGAEGIYVLEVSSYQLELTPSAGFDVAVLTNITPDHLDRHGGMDGYIAAKRRVFAHPPDGAVAIVGLDSEASRSVAEALIREGRVVVGVSGQRALNEGVCVLADRLADTAFAEGGGFATGPFPALPGAHNRENAACAYAVCRALGLEPGVILAGLESFPGLAHRQQLCAVIDGVSFVNDSKATNPDAAARALASYDRVVWIAGGRAKEGGFGALDPVLWHAGHAVLIGEAAEAIEGWIAGRAKVARARDMAQAVETAFALARPEEGAGSVVLLSPACASFDQFTDFEARGRAFAEAVAALPGDDRDIRWTGAEGGEAA